MKVFTVTCTEECDRCKGDGAVANPLWATFFAEQKQNPALTEDEFARNHGYRDARAMGSEEEPCPECEGAGSLTYDVPLQDALKALGMAIAA